MTTLRFLSFSTGLILASTGACSGDDGAVPSGGSSSDSTGGTVGQTNPTDGLPGDSTANGATANGATATMGSTADDTTAGAADSTSAGTTEGGSTTDASACATWLVTYDLTGSVFQIDAFQSFTITLEEPYDNASTMGPGTMTLRFADDGGAPAAGTATMVEYALTQNFTTGSAGTNVTTALDNTAAFDACGVANGTLGADVIIWQPAEISPYCQDGMVSCSGGFCGQFGSPPADMPIIFDNDCTATLTLNTFAFTDGIDAFTMPPVPITDQTTLAFVGTMTDMTLDAATPECACG